ncbi:MAG TPA: hypothetical protein GXX40_08985 [Firmicutes bacterium]|nr:hypothetical protein [Bacillota bacterium]
MIGGVRSTAATAPQIENAKPGMSRKDFLRVLCAELSNQNPLEPMKNAEFVSQLAQFSQIEYLDQAQKLQLAANVLGRSVKLKDGADSTPVEGIVESISFERGWPEICVGGKLYQLDSLLEVKEDER